MAKEPESKIDKFKTIFTDGYTLINILGVFAALFAITVSLDLILGNRALDPTTPIIGEHQTIFQWTIFSLGIIMILIVGYPVYEPSFKELKNVTYPTKAKFLDNTFRVVGFMLFFIFVFYLYDQMIVSILIALGGGGQ